MGDLWIWMSVALFALLLGFHELGFRLVKRRAQEASKGEGVVSGIVFALLSLILSFSFSVGVGRFEARRHLIVDEANAIGTTYLRIDLLPESSQPGIRQDMVRYVDARLAYNQALSTGTDATRSISASNALQGRIWSAAMKAYREDPHESTRVLLTPAMNQMFDLAASRTEAAETRVPWLIFLLLSGLALVSALLAGKTDAVRRWGHPLMFASLVAFVIYVISDLDDPRQGFIRVDSSDRILQDLRSTMR